MSVTAPAPAQAPGGPQQRPGPEACPLCGAPLAPEQEWCLRCGAAARTRLAAAPNWRAPFTAVALIAALSLGVLVAALVTLAGDTGPAPPAITHTITSAAPAASAAPPTATAPTATAPAAGTAGGTAAGGAAATGIGAGQHTTPNAAGTPTAPTTGTSAAPKTTPGKGKPLSPDAQKAIERLNLSGKIK